MGVSGSFSYPAFEALRDANETLAGMFAATPTFLNLVVDGQAEIASGLAATGDYFRVLGVQPAAGRVIGPDDDRPGAEPVAMISHSFRERRFGPEASPTGTVIRVNDVPTTIVGVLPPGYAGISRPAGAAADVHLPLATLPLPEGDDRLADATFWWLPIMGRLKPGATPAQVRGNLDGVLQAAAQSTLASLLDGLTEEERGRARYRNRSAEPRLLVDSGRQGLYDANRRSSGQALILGVAVTLVLLIVCANVVTLLLSREVSRQREGAIRMSVGATRGRLIRQLVTESLFLSAAGAMLALPVAWAARRLANLRGVDVGFNPERVLLFQMDSTRNGYAPENSVALYARIGDRVRGLPGVRSVTMAQTALLGGGVWMSDVRVEGRTGAGRPAHMMTVAPGFFDTMEIPLLAGRGFEPRDDGDAPHVAVVNAAAARELFGTDDAVGRRFGFQPEERDGIEVVGVVRDTRCDDLRGAAPPTVFRSAVQSPLRSTTFAVRTAGPPNALTPAVRESIRQIDPRLPIINVTTQTAAVEERLSDERIFALAYASFGGLATLLAAIGLFGLASYTVTRRTGERRPDGPRRTCEEQILLTVLRLGGESYAVPVARELGRLTAREVCDSAGRATRCRWPGSSAD